MDPSSSPRRGWLTGLALGAVWLYLGFLALWTLLRLGFGDRWWWLFFLNVFAEYLFVPVVLVAVVAALVHTRAAWFGLVVCVALWVWMYGGLYVPKAHAGADRTLTVMSYNALGTLRRPEPVAQLLRQVGADVVGIQELNPVTSGVLNRELTDLYPYQLQNGLSSVRGMGLVSRYPMRSSDLPLGGEWTGSPQVVTIDVAGTEIVVLNLHAVSVYGGRSFVETTVAARERAAQIVTAYARTETRPLIVFCDCNTTDQTSAYHLVTEDLTDTWREIGWGPGHSWGPFDGRLWLVRIDYILHSRQFQALDASPAPWDGGSDHRPVMATLQLRP